MIQLPTAATAEQPLGEVSNGVDCNSRASPQAKNKRFSLPMRLFPTPAPSFTMVTVPTTSSTTHRRHSRSVSAASVGSFFLPPAVRKVLNVTSAPQFKQSHLEFGCAGPEDHAQEDSGLVRTATLTEKDKSGNRRGSKVSGPLLFTQPSAQFRPRPTPRAADSWWTLLII